MKAKTPEAIERQRTYMREYMRKRRGGKPTSQLEVYRETLTEIRTRMSDSPTEKGQAIYRLADDALGGEK